MWCLTLRLVFPRWEGGRAWCGGVSGAASGGGCAPPAGGAPNLARVCESGGMNLRHPGCALLLKRMMLVKAVPAMMSLGLGVLHLLIAMMADISLASSAGLEKGSHASVGGRAVEADR